MKNSSSTGQKAFGCLFLSIIFIVFFVLFFTGNNEPEEPLTPEQIAQKQISDQFNYDGMHFTVAYMVQDNLNDPDSFEHIETVYEEKKDHLLILMKYRASNVFNAKIKKEILVRVTKDTGTVLEIVKQ